MLKSQQLNALVKASYVHPQGHKLRKACYNYMMLTSRKAHGSVNFEQLLPQIQELPVAQQAEVKEDIIKASIEQGLNEIKNYVKVHGGSEVADFYNQENLSINEILKTKVPDAIASGLKTVTKTLKNTLAFCVDAITLRTSDTYLEEMDEKWGTNLTYSLEHKALVFLPRLLFTFALAVFFKNVMNGTSFASEFLSNYAQYAGMLVAPAITIFGLSFAFNPRGVVKIVDKIYSTITTPITTSWDIITHLYENLNIKGGFSWLSDKLTKIWETVVEGTSRHLFANQQFKQAYLQALKSY